MFNDTKTLIVVFKDEMLLNQIRKLVETKDDTDEGIVGTKDGSIKIISWNEKMWLGQKKMGNINNKVLFIDDIKETDQLIPLIEVKFEKHGVMYGWAGNQAVITCDPKKLTEEEYQEFLNEIKKLDIPDEIKNANKNPENDDLAKQDAKGNLDNSANEKEEADNKDDSTNIFSNLRNVAEVGAELFGDAFDIASKNVEGIVKSITRDKTAMRRQLLFYGIINLYYDDLETFMNS